MLYRDKTNKQTYKKTKQNKLHSNVIYNTIPQTPQLASLEYNTDDTDASISRPHHYIFLMT